MLRSGSGLPAGVAPALGVPAGGLPARGVPAGSAGPGPGSRASRGWSRSARRAAAVIAFGVAAGCARGADHAGPVAPDPEARAQIMINAGNQAFHAGDYRLAARRYAAAAVIRRDDPVAYFGLGMALTRLGRDEDARAAYARARELAQQQREQRH